MTCKARSYPDEATARRCLWAMTQRGFNTNHMSANRCACGAWHVGRHRTLTRTERLQAAADAGFDTHEDYRGER